MHTNTHSHLSIQFPSIVWAENACNWSERRSYLVSFILDVIKLSIVLSMREKALYQRHSATSHAPQLIFPAHHCTTTSIKLAASKQQHHRISVQTIKQLISVCDWINYISSYFSWESVSIVSGARTVAIRYDKQKRIRRNFKWKKKVKHKKNSDSKLNFHES